MAYHIASGESTFGWIWPIAKYLLPAAVSNDMGSLELNSSLFPLAFDYSSRSSTNSSSSLSASSSETLSGPGPVIGLWTAGVLVLQVVHTVNMKSITVIAPLSTFLRPSDQEPGYTAYPYERSRPVQWEEWGPESTFSCVASPPTLAIAIGGSRVIMDAVNLYDFNQMRVQRARSRDELCCKIRDTMAKARGSQLLSRGLETTLPHLAHRLHPFGLESHTLYGNFITRDVIPEVIVSLDLLCVGWSVM